MFNLTTKPVSAGELMKKEKKPINLVVEKFISQGVHFLAGHPKSGKYWLSLWLALCVSNGNDLWGFKTNKSKVLYFCLEDTENRIQDRLEGMPGCDTENLLFMYDAPNMDNGFDVFLKKIVKEEPEVKLVIVDTFQLIRGEQFAGNAYACEYAEMNYLKKLAKELDITIILVHHLRKMHDSSPQNMISGSTALAGGADTTFVLYTFPKKKGYVILHCKGRDTDIREIELRFGFGTHIWDKISDSVEDSEGMKMVEILTKLLDESGPFSGTATELCKLIKGGRKIVGYDTMKNKSSRRTMPLIPAVEKILLEHKAKQEEYMKLFGDSYSREYLDYVCVDPLGNILKPDFVTEHFTYLLKENNLKKIRFHDLRHTCASLLLANGISMKHIQEWLGHSDFSTTANIYAHLEYDTKLQSAEMMTKVIGKGGISKEAYLELLDSFPKTAELNKYAHYRIANILKEFFPECDKYEEIYEKFILRKNSNIISQDNSTVSKSNLAIELAQFSVALEQLKTMLSQPDGITEAHWQKKIQDILQILYPKYILCTREISFKGTDGYDKRPDFMLVDANGFVDILEIKKPDVPILTKQASYRNNYVPVREFAGAIQQIEKYIFCLTSLEKSQKEVLKKLEDILPESITPEIVNPQGILLLGRSKHFNAQEKRDFELIKRQYKNIADIMTYDDLEERLKNIINSLKQRV